MKKVFFSCKWAGEEFHPLVENVRQKLAALGVVVTGVDPRESDDFVTKTTLDLIRDAQVLVGWVWDSNPNVLFEIGYAMGLGKKVLLVLGMDTALPPDLMLVDTIRQSISPSDMARQILQYLNSLNEPAFELHVPQTAEEIFRSYYEAPELFERVSVRQFEEAIRSLFELQGCRVGEPEQPQDYGYDFFAVADGRQMLIEVKKFNVNSRISIGHVQQLLGALFAYKADKGVLITTSQFTEGARHFASQVHPTVELWDMDTTVRKLLPSNSPVLHYLGKQ